MGWGDGVIVTTKVQADAAQLRAWIWTAMIEHLAQEELGDSDISALRLETDGRGNVSAVLELQRETR
jgi:hypothetical protein